MPMTIQTSEEKQSVSLIPVDSMTPLSPDGKILKHILTEGSGPMPPKGALVKGMESQRNI